MIHAVEKLSANLSRREERWRLLTDELSDHAINVVAKGDDIKT